MPRSTAKSVGDWPPAREERRLPLLDGRYCPGNDDQVVETGVACLCWIERNHWRGGVSASPVPGLLLEAIPLVLVLMRDAEADGEVEQRVVEDGDDGHEDLAYRQRRAPVAPEDVQVHLPLLVHVRMVHLGFEGELRGPEGVVARDHDVDGECASGVGAAVGAVDDHREVERVRHGRRAGTAEIRQVDPQRAHLLEDPLQPVINRRHGRRRCTASTSVARGLQTM